MRSFTVHSQLAIQYRHDLLAANPTNAYMATLMVCGCLMIIVHLNSACCKLFLYNEAQDNNIHIDIPTVCMGNVCTVYTVAGMAHPS